jgi:hypothetical protein
MGYRTTRLPMTDSLQRSHEHTQLCPASVVRYDQSAHQSLVEDAEQEFVVAD